MPEEENLKEVQLPQRTKAIVKKKKSAFNRGDQLSTLEVYEKDDNNNLLNQPFKPVAGFSGPEKMRKMTDRMCIPVFVILLLATIFHAVILIAYGDTNRLPNGIDFRGEICGIKGLVHLPYLYYGSPTQDINLQWCVASCPLFTGNPMCLYDIDHFTTTPFCYVQMSSQQIGRQCLPQEPINRALVDLNMQLMSNQIKRFASDLWLTWDLIFFSLVLMTATSYIITYYLSEPSVVLYEIWLAIWGSLVCFGVLAWMFYREYQRLIRERCLFGIDKHDCGGQRAMLFQYICLFIAVIGLAYLIYIIRLFNKINLGIGLIKAASKIVVVLGQLRFFAVLVAFIGLFFTGFCYMMIIYGLTIGNISTILGSNINGNYEKKYTATDYAQQSLGLPAFMAIFILMLVLALNEMFNSYALSVWFFTKKKDVVEIPLKLVFKELMSHHFGTCIYITLMQIFFTVPRMVMYYVHQSLRSLPQTSLIVRFLQGCCLCCLSCYQNCLRYISKHSMVQVAVWSDSYSIASEKSFFILQRNQNKVQDLDFLVEFILFQLKLCNSLFMSIPIYIYLSFAQKTPQGLLVSDIESPLFPTLFVFVCGFFYTSVFQGTYDICAKSVIQLYLIDREMFYAEQRYSEDFIQKFMDFYGKETETQIRIKSNKQLQFNAKVAPMMKKKQEHLSDDEEDEEEEQDLHEEDLDEDDEDPEQSENDEQDLSEAGHTHIMNVRPKMGKLIDADPFELGDHEEQTTKPVKTVFANNMMRNKPILQAPIVLSDKDMGMGYTGLTKMRVEQVEEI